MSEPLETTLSGVARLLLTLTQWAILIGLAEVGSAEVGSGAARAIIVEHCAKCHAAPGYESHLRAEGVQTPSFVEIAREMESPRRESLRRFLRKPHFPMQQFALSESDIDHVLAYLDELRDAADR